MSLRNSIWISLNLWCLCAILVEGLQWAAVPRAHEARWGRSEDMKSDKEPGQGLSQDSHRGKEQAKRCVRDRWA